MSATRMALARVFVNHDLRRIVLAFGCFSFALWCYAIALGVYAFDAGGATAVGIAALVRLLPGALASPFAGLLGDRHSRRRVLLLSSTCSAMALAGSVAAVAMGAPAGVVYGLAGVFTVAISPYIPAEGALLPFVSKAPQELSAANVVHSAMDNVGFLAGALLSGALVALGGPELAFAASALAAVIAVLLLIGLTRDERPAFAESEDVTGVLHETGTGFRILLADSKIRLVALLHSLLAFFEGAADVLVVIIVLDLLDLGEGTVGYLSAGWGVGALIAGGMLAGVLNRGNLAFGLVAGCFVTGAAMALPGFWPVVGAAVIAWIGIGIGYTFVEVAARTLIQRLGSDEALARVAAAVETSLLTSMALGSIAASALVALLGIRGAVIAVGALLPAFALLRWRALRSYEIGAPVAERSFELLRGDPIFEPLPVDALERLSRDAITIEAAAGNDVITQGDHGDRFYLIDEGEVEVFENGTFRRSEGPGESFGEIALLRDVPRTATVRATRDCRLLAIDREHFIAAVTGHHRSHETAASVAEVRLTGPPQSG